MNENENLQISEIEDTTPEQTFEETTDVKCDNIETATPNGEKLPQKNIARDAEISAQKTASDTADNKESFVTVQYNHKTKELSKEEAVQLIQKGMHTESLRTKLEYLADRYGTDVNSLVEKMVAAPEEAHRLHLEQLYGKGSEDVEIGMQIYREKQTDQYKKMLAERKNGETIKKNDEEIKSVNSRLANEYLKLKSEIPEAPDYANLPDSVIIEAAQGSRDLLSAYLCYLNREKIKIDAAKKTQQAANIASSNSMKSENVSSVNSQERSFLSGLWGK